MGGDSVVVGRGEEIALLRALASRRRSVVLFGPPGVGKTRLARQVADEVAASGSTTAWVAATRSARDIPLAALSAVFGSDVIVGGPAAGTAWVLRSVRDQRSGGAAVLPDVLVVDDVQWLDAVSATLLHQLVYTGDAMVLLVATTGTEPCDAITALWKDGSADRVDLQPLSRDEADELVRALVGPCTPITLERVWERTQGNPLFVRELLHAARASGSLSERGGRCHFDGEGVLQGPLIDLVRARIDALDRPVRTVLELVALSAPVSLWLLEQLADPDAIASAEEMGLLEVTDERSRVVVRAGVPVHDEAIRVLMPAARRRAHCRALADALDATGLRRRDDLLRALTLRLDAAETPPIELLLRGAWQATDALDLRLGERLGRAALSADPDDHRARLALSDALYRQTRHAEAIDMLAPSVPANDRERTEIAVAMAKAEWGLGRAEDAEARIAATAAAVSDESCLGWLQSFHATLRTALGFPAEAAALVEPITRQPHLGARTMLSSLSALSLAYAFGGRAADAVAAARRGMDPELLAAAESRTLLSWVEPSLFAAAWLSGDVAQTETLAAVYREIGLKSNDSERTAAGSMGVGWAALLRGDLEVARLRLEEAAALAPAFDRIGIKRLALIGLGWTHAWRGDATEAGLALAAADAAGHAGTRWFADVGAIGRAWVAATAGDVRGGVTLLGQTADDATARGMVPYAVLALHAMARLGEAAAAVDRLTALVTRVDGPYAPVALAHADALVHEDGDALERCADAFDALEMRLVAAECAAMAARTHARAGSRAAAERSRARAAALLDRCPGARPVTLASFDAHASVLTARELEVARLAREWMDETRDIAERLFVSGRTVDSHLADIYVKLGVTGRHELATALEGVPADERARAAGPG